MDGSSRRSFAFAAAAAAASVSRPAVAQAPGKAGKYRVVFQMSDADPAKWNLALNNMRNVQTDLPDEAPEVELVAYGPGIGMLKGDSVVSQRVAEALKHGVKVVACENTMHGQKLVYADMLPDIGYVPAGVVELMKKQQQGFAYIRP